MKNQYDFSDGKRGAVIKTNKEKITIRLDPEVLQWFRDQVKGGGNYQSLINEALKAHIKQEGQSLETVLRRVIREKMEAERKQVAA
ncbi:MAG: BrnA antitoxin family protein [Thiothrix sp.]